MTPEQVDRVVDAVRALLARPGADVTVAVTPAPIAYGQTVRIEARAFVADEDVPDALRAIGP